MREQENILFLKMVYIPITLDAAAKGHLLFQR